MNDNHSQTAEDALDAARGVLDVFIAQHRTAAIPAMLTACVGWSVENGASDLIEASLRRTADMVPVAARAWQRGLA